MARIFHLVARWRRPGCDRSIPRAQSPLPATCHPPPHCRFLFRLWLPSLPYLFFTLASSIWVHCRFSWLVIKQMTAPRCCRWHTRRSPSHLRNSLPRPLYGSKLRPVSFGLEGEAIPLVVSLKLLSLPVSCRAWAPNFALNVRLPSLLAFGRLLSAGPSLPKHKSFLFIAMAVASLFTFNDAQFVVNFLGILFYVFSWVLFLIL